jgi:hypothetical protein
MSSTPKTIPRRANELDVSGDRGGASFGQPSEGARAIRLLPTRRLLARRRTASKRAPHAWRRWRTPKLVPALFAAVAAAAIVPAGAQAATKQRVALKGIVSVVVSETPSGHEREYFLRRGLRLQALDLDRRERRMLRPNARVLVVGRRVGSTIEVGRVRTLADPPPLTVTGTRSVLILRVFWQTQDGVTVQQAEDQVAVTDDAFFRENSYNRLGLTATATQWLQIPQPSSCGDTQAINNSTQTAAANAGIDTDEFDHNMIYISSADCTGRGFSEIDGRITWIQGTMNTYRTGHELGHNFGPRHANSKSCVNAAGAPVTLSGTCTDTEYGDRFNVMGGVPPGGENSPTHISAPQKDLLGWLPGRSQTATQGTFTLAAMDDQARRLHALRLNTPSGTLWLEYRRATGFDAPLASFPGITGGVVVHQPRQTSGSWLLDMTPGSTAGFSDAALPVGRTWTTPDGTLTVRVNSAGPAGASVTIGPGRCEPIRRQIVDNEADIRDRQAELHAEPGHKAAIMREIRSLQAENRHLRAEAAQLGCRL